MEWISVHKKLPETEKHVLTVDVNGNVGFMQFKQTDDYYSAFYPGKYWRAGNWFVFNITKWAAIEPPVSA